MGFRTLELKLIKVIKAWPESRKDEEVPGMDMTWKKLAFRVVKYKRRTRTESIVFRLTGWERDRSKLRALVEKAAEAGLIRR